MSVEKKCMDQLKEKFPNMEIKYGDLQNFVESLYMKKSASGLIRSNMSPDDRDEGINVVTKSMLDAYDVLSSANTFDESIFILAVENLKRKGEVKSVSVESYIGTGKNNNMLLPKISIIQANGNPLEIEVLANIQKDEVNNDISHIRATGKFFINGSEVDQKKIDGSLNQFCRVLSESSFGDTVELPNVDRVYVDIIKKNKKGLNVDSELLVNALNAYEQYQKEKIKLSQSIISKAVNEAFAKTTFKNIYEVARASEYSVNNVGSSDDVENKEGYSLSKRVKP